MQLFNLKYTTVLLGFLFSVSVSAQESDRGGWCLTDELFEEELKNNPELQQQVEESHQEYLEFVENYEESSNTRNAQFIIPVVFHVIHDNCNGNVSREQLEDALAVLNEDYRRQNTDTSATRSIFKDVAADAQIEFRLARRDPNGNCTDGIVRVNDPENTYNVRNEAKTASPSWPAEKYLNVWLVNSIRGGSGGTVLGFARFPSGGPSGYGIVQRHDRTGRIGTAAGEDGRTFTHEVGHCLNLYHTFQSGCGGNCSSSGDHVCDTPPSAESTFQCNTNQNSCSNDTQGPSPFTQDMPDQFENYMSYDACQNMFSQGQKIRMISALNNFAFLTNLVSQSNLEETGVLNYSTDVCGANFSVQGEGDCENNIIQVCSGQPVQFENRSFDNPSEFEWYFEGGTPSSSHVENPAVVYSKPGLYDVRLKVKDTNHTEADEFKSQYVQVVPFYGQVAPVHYDFDFGHSLLDQGWLPKRFETGYGWELTGSESIIGHNAVKMNNFNYSGGEAALTTETFDLSYINSASVTFRTAFSKIDNSNETFRVQFSSDCGETWSNELLLQADDLSSAPESGAPLSDLAPGDWIKHEINIDNQHLQPGFRVRFTFNGGGGNDLYLDDFRISGNVNTTTPTLNKPLNEEENVARDPLFDWNPAQGSSYRIQWSTSADFDIAQGDSVTLAINNGNLANGNDTRHRIKTKLDAFTTYYWRVKAVTASDQNKPWSEVYSFTTGDQTTDAPVHSAEKSSSVSVYPNPARNNVFIKHDFENARLNVMNVTGQTLISRRLQSTTENEIDVSKLPGGVYLFRFIDESGQTVTERVVISK